ncbi:putative ferric-chelate reductase 1 [Dicentrarchus labrax]|uniref:putative ferric-chelate reductase 1 n=1 Tax=Dicentrarchus labrax TaxID=13489 RepID=UPI0021F67CEA|nr:putative ferric-chelate reductase 1 [Dicentrarchus labrax]
MERGLILLVAAFMVYVAPGVQGTAHLSFASNTEVNITRTGCGVTKLCVETPGNCDPSGTSSCLFGSVVANTSATNGAELSIELRGDSEGYIALGLTVNASEGTTMLFICAQNSSNNGSFFFRTMLRNNSNNEQSAIERIVKEIRGTVNGSVIKCEFNIPNVNATQTRANEDTTFSILLGTGTFDGNALGTFNVTLNSGPLNLGNSASNVATTPAPTPSTSMTTAGSGAVHPHAVLLLLSVLTLSVLLRA